MDFRTIIERSDFEELEDARSAARVEHIPELIQLYNEVDDWEARSAIVAIVQDQDDVRLRDVMIDYLRAPYRPNVDWTEIHKAIALSFVDEEYDRFMSYYSDRDLLRHDVDAVLAEHGLELDTASEPPEKPNIDDARIAQIRTEPLEHQLYFAAACGYPDLVQELLEQGVSVDDSPTGETPLMGALVGGYGDIARRLLQAGASGKIPRPTANQTALSWACWYGFLDIAQAIARQGVDLDEADIHGSTALHTAAQRGHGGVVTWLLDAGADPYVQISDGRTPLRFAIYNGYLDAAVPFFEQGHDVNELWSGTYPIHIATAENHRKIVKYLVDHGADVEVRVSGLTPLMVAAQKGYTAIVRLLLKNGSDPDAEAGGKYRGKTAYALARGSRADAVRKVFDKHTQD